MFNLPFIKYIQSLIICKMPNDQILQKVQDLNVQFAKDFKEEYIVEVYKSLYKSNPGFWKNDTKAPDLTWLRELEIEKFVCYQLNLELENGTHGIQGALEIINDPDMYKVITALALAKINDEDIELIVNGKYNIHYDMDDIKEFLRYFFDVANWSVSEKKSYVNMIIDNKLKKTYQIALDGDKDYLIWKLGIAPDKSFDQMLRDMMADAYYSFKETSKVSTDTAQKWGNLALRITDRVDRLDKESSDKKSLFDQIMFKINNPEAGETIEITKKFKHYKDLDENDIFS